MTFPSRLPLLLAFLGFLSLSSLPPLHAQSTVTFDFVPVTGSPGWGAIDQFIRAYNAPVSYVTGYGSDAINQWSIAPAGSWLLYGTQPDVSISTNNGATWTIVAGTTSSNSHLDLRDVPANFPGSGAAGETAGNAGCAHRGPFNRFYILGNVVGDYTRPTSTWFAWATQDGSVWYQSDAPRTAPHSHASILRPCYCLPHLLPHAYLLPSPTPSRCV